MVDNNKNLSNKATVSTVDRMSPLLKKLRLFLLIAATVLLTCVLGLQIYNYLKSRSNKNQNQPSTSNSSGSNNTTTNKQPASEDPPKESHASSAAPPEGTPSAPEPPKVQVTE